jgi:HK97 family phage major capsid protein
MPSQEELVQARTDAREAIVAHDRRWKGKAYDEDGRREWDELSSAYLEADKAVAEGARARQMLLQLAQNGRSAIEAVPRDPLRMDQPDDLRERTRDALRAIDREHQDGVLTERAALVLDGLVRRDEFGTEARYIAAVSDPAYRSAFLRLLGRSMTGGYTGLQAAQAELSDSEREAMRQVSDSVQERALSIGTTTAGGFAVPFQLDPTLILSSSGQINPFRDICRVEQVTTNEWRGVSTAGMTAVYQAEAAEVTDASPTLAQPIAYAETARAFVPFSVEIGMDWQGLAQEMQRLFADAKDLLESDKFVTGPGHGLNQPDGLFTSATAVVSTTAATTLAIGDIYSLKAALPSRFQPNARWVGHPTNLDRVRRLVGPGNTTEPPIWADSPPSLLRRPAHESSAYPSTLATGGSILSVGDFSHMLIVDRIGMQVELVPHLLGANRLPTLQRGLIAWWRSSSKVLVWNAFRTLKVS